MGGDECEPVTVVHQLGNPRGELGGRDVVGDAPAALVDAADEIAVHERVPRTSAAWCNRLVNGPALRPSPMLITMPIDSVARIVTGAASRLGITPSMLSASAPPGLAPTNRMRAPLVSSAA